MVIIGQTTFREKFGMDVMAHLKASVLKARGREDGPEIATTVGAVGEPNDGALLRTAMTVTAFGPGLTTCHVMWTITSHCRCLNDL